MSEEETPPKSIIPDGFESVGTPVPIAQHWRSLQFRPDDFDPNSIWVFTQKLKDATGKQYALCVFCLKIFGGWNATKMQFHSSGLTTGEIAACLGLSNGQVPTWFRDCSKSAHVEKINEAQKVKNVGISDT